MKITGAAPVPLLPDDSLLCPDPCLSNEIRLDPIDSTLFTSLADREEEEHVSNLLTDEDEDIGDFLLDAVDWL